MAGETVIETRALSKTYRDFWGRPKVRALKALDLEIKQGEVFGLLGPNGSGKTTTIKLLLGPAVPHRRPGAHLRQRRHRRQQEPAPRLPAGRVVSVPLPECRRDARLLRPAVRYPARRSSSERIDSLIKIVGLDRARKRQLKEYSKGMTRRIGLAQALINEPELILLDEPTSGLDPIGTREMKDMILRLQDQGTTVVMCSHLLADVQDVCDRIAILHQGELKELGRVDTLLTQADVTQIRAKRLPDQCINEIRQVIDAAQRRVDQRRASDHNARRAVPLDRARQRSPPGPACRRR